jgi:glycosyltransferase involved in cell wall biosynthesis
VSSNLHISLTRFTHESRLLKEVHTLFKKRVFKRIIVAALHEKRLATYEKVSDGVEVYRICLKTRFFPKNLLFHLIKYLEFTIQILQLSKRIKPDVVNCHSIKVLPIGAIVKLFFRTKLVYDTHELETETHGLVGLRQRMMKILEASLIPFVDKIIVVSDSIRKWYEKSYKRNDCYVIKNFPQKRGIYNFKSHILKEEFGLSEKNILFIYQGNLGSGRGIEVLLDVFGKLKHEKHIVFMGYGELKGRIIEYARRYKNIHFLPAVPPDEVGFYTMSADVGINLTDNSCLSRYFALSNKLFEYLNNGIPVIVSDFPERGGLVDRYSCGWKIEVKERVEEEHVYRLINSLSKGEIDQKKNTLAKLNDTFVWENQEEMLVQVYSGLNLRKA